MLVSWEGGVRRNWHEVSRSGACLKSDWPNSKRKLIAEGEPVLGT